MIKRVSSFLQMSPNSPRNRRFSLSRVSVASTLLLTLLFAGVASAQVAVLTQHNDISRTGANTNETILTTANVNQNTFGKLFAYPVDGRLYAQPLYVPNLTISGKGVHNVIFAATEHDSIYAFDADTNGGSNATPLWKITLLDAAHGAGAGATTVPNGDLSTADITPEIGITGTPTIDLSTNTMYVVGKTKESGNYFQRLHAIDITTGAEKFGGPVLITGSVPGNGNGSVNGTLTFDPKWENQRPGLLLLNGIVYIGFASHGDNGPWHGWVIAYNASTLQQTSIYCTAPDGIGSGIWMSGAGLAADVPDPVNHPFGRMFITTGNGSFNATTPPYTNRMNFGDDHIRLDLTNGVLTVSDSFTPNNQATLNGGDTDVASGGIVLLPDQTAGGHTRLMTQIGKEGRIYLIDRDNMGGYNATADQLVQSITGQSGGLWSIPAFWNNKLYTWAVNRNLKAFTLTNGLFSTTPTSQGTLTSSFPGASPSVSSNGNTNGIVWAIQTDQYNNTTTNNAYLHAFDANDVSVLLYSSKQNPSRDTAGIATKFATPTIANGKVYVGTANELDVYGLFSTQQQTATPVISPAGQNFSGTLTITITDSTPSSTIYYTTDGTPPTTSSNVYSGPFAITTTQTITAVASATGFLQSSLASQTYTSLTQVAAPTFSPTPAVYVTPQSVTLSDSTAGAAIYYTTDGSTPVPNSGTTVLYTAPFTVSVVTTVKAIGVKSGFENSPVASAVYTIAQGGTGSTFVNGFSTATSSMTFNGSTGLADTRLQLTSGVANQKGTAWFNIPVTIGSFTNDFAFQLENPDADGITFAIQNQGLNALGNEGGGLAYQNITPSVAIKFDIYSNAGEGNNSTGLYTNGAAPFTPSVDLTPSGINLKSGHTFNVHMVYDGTTLTMTITDGITNQTFTTSWTVNIPAIVGANTAYVGFTGGCGGLVSSQKILTWVFTSAVNTAAAPTFSPTPGTYTSAQNVTLASTTQGASIFYTTDGSTPATAVGGSTKLYSAAIPVSTTTTIKAIATANGFSPSAVSSGTYTFNITGVTSISFPSGFAAGGMIFNGSTALSGTSLRLTNGGTNQAASAWYNLPANVSTFATDFNFLVTSGVADGFAFVIQNNSTAAMGPAGGGLGYGPDGPTGTQPTSILKSVAIKFDLYSNAGEGNNSTGLYTNGASPTTPFIALTGVDLHAGHVMAAHITYDGTNMVLTLKDTTTNATFTQTWPVNLSTVLGSSVSYVGFTAGTGGSTAIQDIQSWTFTTGNPNGTAATPTFSPVAGTYASAQAVTISSATSGATIYYTLDGSNPTVASTQYTGPVTVASSATLKAIAVATGYANSAVGSAAYVIQTAAATPVISPAAGTYTSAQTVSITDATSGAVIYYTTNGAAPTTASPQYTAPFTVSTTSTVKAIAVASGFANSAVASSTFTIQLPAATPVFSPAGGTFTTSQSVSITDATSGATIYYTSDGSTPSTSSTVYSGPISVASSKTLKAIAVASGFSQSAVASATFTINTGGATSINFSNGFTTTGLQINGGATINGTRLRLTDTGTNEARTVYWNTPVNVQSFTSDFTFQNTSAVADGFTFVIQNAGLTAKGSAGGSLAYGGSTPITKSVAVKFDIYSNSGEGTSSTGMYTNGASPTTPFISTAAAGINLRSTNIIQAHLTYDGTTLALTLTDTVTAKVFTTSWAVNIPTAVGGNTAYVGFTAGTGGSAAIQEILNWTFSNNAAKTPVVYSTTNLTAVSSGPTFRSFTYSGFPDGVGTILDATKVNDNVTFTVNVAAAGTYDIKVSVKKHPARGIMQLAINGANVGPTADQYNATEAFATFDLGNFNFTAAGNYAFKFNITGKNASSTGFSESFDDITLTPQ